MFSSDNLVLSFNSDDLVVVKHSVAKVIFLSNSMLATMGANAAYNDLFERLPLLLLPLLPLSIFYDCFEYEARLL